MVYSMGSLKVSTIMPVYTYMRLFIMGVFMGSLKVASPMERLHTIPFTIKEKTSM
jgi:hypothetical protein